MDLLIIPMEVLGLGNVLHGPIEAAMMRYKVPFGLHHQFPWSQLRVHEP